MPRPSKPKLGDAMRWTSDGFPIRRRARLSARGNPSTERLPWHQMEHDFVFGCMCKNDKRGWPTVRDLAKMYETNAAAIHARSREFHWQEKRKDPAAMSHAVVDKGFDEQRRLAQHANWDFIHIMQAWCVVQMDHYPGERPDPERLRDIGPEQADRVMTIAQRTHEMMLLSGGMPTQIAEARSDISIESRQVTVQPDVVRAFEAVLTGANVVDVDVYERGGTAEAVPAE